MELVEDHELTEDLNDNNTALFTEMKIIGQIYVNTLCLVVVVVVVFVEVFTW